MPPDEGTDFDDMRRAHGLDLVRAWLESAHERDDHIAEKAEGMEQTAGGQEAPKKWRQLVEAILDATVAGDESEAMELRAEAIARFRRTDGQIDAALFKLLTERETGVKRKPIGERTGVSLRKASGLDYLIDGFIIANDQTMISAAHGTGKTTAMLDATFAMLEGEAFLDHGKPSAPRVADDTQVIYIASDSDAGPVKASLQAMGLDTHPWVDDGPQRRIHVWASDPEDGQTKWTADIAGCLELLTAVKARPTALVIVDSCKATFDAYCDNSAVTALLTFFKQVICRHTAVVWLNHDGKERGAGAGAKAWREVPSICHHIERVECEGGTIRRKWFCIKNRIGTERSFEYELDPDTDRLMACSESAVVKDCSEAVLEVLRMAWRNGKPAISKADLADEIRRRYSYSEKSVSNTLTRMKKARWPFIVQPPGGRGQYALAPRLIEDLKADQSPIYGGSKREGTSLKPLQGKDLSDFPSSSLGNSLGNSEGEDDQPHPPSGGNGSDELVEFPREFPREDQGKKAEALLGQGLSPIPSQTAPRVYAECEGNRPDEATAEGDRPLMPEEAPEFVAGSEWVDPSFPPLRQGVTVFLRVDVADRKDGIVLSKRLSDAPRDPVVTGIKLTAGNIATLVRREVVA